MGEQHSWTQASNGPNVLSITTPSTVLDCMLLASEISIQDLKELRHCQWPDDTSSNTESFTLTSTVHFPSSRRKDALKKPNNADNDDRIDYWIILVNCDCVYKIAYQIVNWLQICNEMKQNYCWINYQILRSSTGKFLSVLTLVESALFFFLFQDCSFHSARLTASSHFRRHEGHHWCDAAAAGHAEVETN